jgi:hypothetical protein
MLAVQLAEADNVEPQVFVEMAKSCGLAPTKPMLLMEMELLVLFVSVADFAPPVLPTATVYQEIELGEAAT